MKVTKLFKPINFWDIAANNGQINLIKFVEWNKFDKGYSKVWNIFAWSIFLKIWCVLIHQIIWMKNIKSNFKSLRRRKIEENPTNESTGNIFVTRFSFGVLATLIFVIYFLISSFTKTNNLSKHSWVSSILYSFSSSKQGSKRRIYT